MIRMTSENSFCFDEEFVDYVPQIKLFEGKLPTFLLDYLHDIKSTLLLQSDDNKEHFLFLCDVLVDMSWEMLNTNLWVFVGDQWRLVYGYATLYKIILINTSRKTTRADYSGDDLIKLCDLGLLMSGFLLRQKFQQIIKLIGSGSDSTSMRFMPEVALENSVLTKGGSSLPIEYSPTVETFKMSYLDEKMPVIIADQMNHWPAMRKWSIDYLINLAGKRTVPVEIGSKYTDDDWSQKLMTIEDFIQAFIVNPTSANNKGYLAQHPLFYQIPELKEDIYVPEYCYYLSEVDDVDSSVDINAWFGPAGTVSPLHYDPKHNFLCQVIGKKYVRLYHEKYSGNLYAQESTILQNTSKIDPENLDETKFPLSVDVPFWEGVLSEGQMLYIPPKCWHYIRSLTLSFSVSFWWE